LQHVLQRQLPGQRVTERFVLNLKMGRVWQRNYINHVEAMCDIGYFGPS
jgi:hypothetical protein